jgi:hypothetical protein
MRIGAFALLLLFTTLIASAQSDKHRMVKGTKYSLVPPAGFKMATNFAGFHNETNGASIMLSEVPAPYATISEAMTESALKNQGMTLLDRETIAFNGGQATLIKMSQPANGVTYRKQLLVFGDAKNTVLVNAVYPESSKGLEAAVRTALLSTTFNETQSDNPLDAVSFQIDVSGTDFKLAKFLSGNLIYTTDGQVPTAKPSLVVSPSLKKIAPASQRQYAINRLKQYPRGESITLEQINPIEIDGLKGYEIRAKGKNKEDKPELVYQVMLFTKTDDYYLIVGMTTEEFDKRLTQYQTIAKTFRRK